MGILAIICFFVGLASVAGFLSFISKKIKSKKKKSKNDFELDFPFNYYEEKPLVFIIVGLIIILLTLFYFSSSIMTIVFPNDLRYKPEGTYCYYVIDKQNNAYPAKIEKVSYESDAGEDYYGNARTETHININLLELYIDNKSYEFYDDPKEIYSDEFTSILYYNEIDNDNGEYEEVEKEFTLKLTKDAAYCPSFGKGSTKINYIELLLEIIIIISEIAMYVITIYVNRKEN